MTIPEGFAQANVRYTGVAVPTGAEVTFGFEHNDIAGGPAAAAALIADIWQDEVMPNTSAPIGLGSVLVKFGPDATGPFAEAPGLGSSGSGSDATSPSVAMLVKKQTLNGGRKGQGRMFLPGYTDGDLATGGDFAPGKVAAVQSDMDSVLSRLETANLPMVLLHQDDGATLPYIVTSLAVQTRAATQRRRLRR